MNSGQDQRAEIDSNLQRGLHLLSAASEREQEKLGIALLIIHSALEDFIRFEVAGKAPGLREQVGDVQQTRWNQLLGYGRTYLGFSDSDCRRINEANALRLTVAHGKEYTIRIGFLVEYANLVERLAKTGQPLPVSISPKTAPAPGRTPVVWRSRDTDRSRRPWYRSTSFLLLTFFFLPPLWASLIITDRSQGCLARLAASSMMLIMVFAGIGFLPYSDLFAGSLPHWRQFLDRPAFTTAVPTSVLPAESSGAETPGNTDNLLQPASGDGGACSLVWVEYTASDLAGKNRSMVWKEIVLSQVHGSGMTAQEFYDLVLEHNPDLKSDGYEFKKGKTYFLPTCQ